MTHTPTAFVNGDYCPLDQAKISILDRGFLFADGVYEVTAVLKGQLVDFLPHIERLNRSCRELGLPQPWSIDELTSIHRELIKQSGLTEGLIYLQVTRGMEEKRNFPFPADTKPSLVMFTQEGQLYGNPMAETGVALASFDDLRWERRDIKSVALLAQVLAKQAAKAAGAFEACMIEDGYVTEGGSSTIGFVKADGGLVLRPLSNAVLPSITRQAALTLAEQTGIPVEYRLFTLDELKEAAEVFMASATSFIMPVTKIDEALIGQGNYHGKPGPVVMRLRDLYFEAAEEQVVQQSSTWS